MSREGETTSVVESKTHGFKRRDPWNRATIDDAGGRIVNKREMEKYPVRRFPKIGKLIPKKRCEVEKQRTYQTWCSYSYTITITFSSTPERSGQKSFLVSNAMGI